ncbi:DUF2917 domain-containing protein [Xylophilus sp. GW821-FHT01B05]
MRTFHTTGRGMVVLRQGAAWITIDAGGAATPWHRHGAAPRGGDWFLSQGGRLAVPAGRRVVVESLTPETEARFDWQPVSAAMPDAAWQLGLALAARRLRRSVRRCARSAAALALGLVYWVAHAASSRGRPAEVPAECTAGAGRKL